MLGAGLLLGYVDEPPRCAGTLRSGTAGGGRWGRGCRWCRMPRPSPAPARTPAPDQPTGNTDLTRHSHTDIPFSFYREAQIIIVKNDGTLIELHFKVPEATPWSR